MRVLLVHVFFVPNICLWVFEICEFKEKYSFLELRLFESFETARRNTFYTI